MSDWYPGATKKPFTEAYSQALITPKQVIHHVTASTGPISGTWNYFETGTNIESHYGVDYGKAYGGVDYAWQGIPNNRRADANYKANPWALSVETRGGEHGEWTPWQVDWLVAHGVWCHRQFGIPLRICRTWDDPGFGYHTLFGAPSPWTPVAKTCPGPNRIKQWRNVVFPRIEALDTPEATLNLDAESRDWLAALIRNQWDEQANAVWEAEQPNPIDGSATTARAILGSTYKAVAAIRSEFAEKVADAVIAKLPDGSPDAAVIKAACQEAVAEELAKLRLVPEQ